MIKYDTEKDILEIGGECKNTIREILLLFEYFAASYCKDFNVYSNFKNKFAQMFLDFNCFEQIKKVNEEENDNDK